MEPDLNQEPLGQTLASVIGCDSILNDLESVHEHIEERIGHLQAVASRVRQHQNLQQGHTPIQVTNTTGGLITANIPYEGRDQEEVGNAVQGRTVDIGEEGKNKSTYLVAKALGMDIDGNKTAGSTANLFDCNICLDMARDPVLTCCGHLFCWPCFYQLPYAYSNTRECPACEGEVTETGIIPIYGNANASSSCQMELKETGLSVPPRPRASRIESLTQQLVSQGASSSTIREVRRFNSFGGGLGERVQIGIPESAIDRILFAQSRTSQPQTVSSLETENNQHTRSHQFSRSLVQGAPSFSLVSSALNSAMDSAERLVSDLEAFLYGNHTGRNRQLNPRAVNRDLPSSTAATTTNQSEIRNTTDVFATSAAAAASVSPLSRNDDAIAVIDSEIQTTNSSVQISSSGPSSSSSGRTDVLRLPNIDNDVSNEPRRRRLR